MIYTHHLMCKTGPWLRELNALQLKKTQAGRQKAEYKTHIITLYLSFWLAGTGSNLLINLGVLSSHV